ncbi:MAG: hypothetical protein SGI89_02130 [bacterium]|nr:hypothetical protein [bacterium]
MIKLEFIEEGRSGYVIYRGAEIKLELYFEFGSNNCVVIIHIPSAKDWKAETGLPINERLNVLNSIARQVISDRVPHGYFSISENLLKFLITVRSLFAIISGSKTQRKKFKHPELIPSCL